MIRAKQREQISIKQIIRTVRVTEIKLFCNTQNGTKGFRDEEVANSLAKGKG